MDGYGNSRVRRNVNVANANLANWTTGVDITALAPGSAARWRVRGADRQR